jgi:ribosomal protein S28E/S33
MGYKRVLPRTGEHAEVVRVQTSVIESSRDVSRRWTRVTRIAVGSIVAGAVLAVVVAVLLSSIATQLLSRLS